MNKHRIETTWKPYFQHDLKTECPNFRIIVNKMEQKKTLLVYDLSWSGCSCRSDHGLHGRGLTLKVPCNLKRQVFSFWEKLGRERVGDQRQRGRGTFWQLDVKEERSVREKFSIVQDKREPKSEVKQLHQECVESLIIPSLVFSFP